MNSRNNRNVKYKKKGQAAPAPKKSFKWVPVIIGCVAILVLLAGGVIAWLLLFGPKNPSIIKFIVDTNSIEVGQSATLSRETKNASVVEIEPVGEVELSGEIQVQPSETTEYTLIGKNEKGKTKTETLTLEVKDITAPSVTIESRPINSNTTQKIFFTTAQKILFTASASDAGGISKVEILINGKVVKECTSTPCAYEGGLYAAGSVSYEGIAYDKAGNKASTGSRSLTIKPADVTPPSVTIKPSPISPIEVKPIEVQPIDITPPSVVIKYSPISPNTTQKVRFIASASDAGGISKVQIAVNGRIVKSCTSTPCTYEGGPYAAGSVSYEGFAYDKAGKKGSTGSKSFTVSKPVLMPIQPKEVPPIEVKPIEVQPKDITAPSVSIRYSPTSPNTTQKVFFIASASDAGGISNVQIAVNGRIVKSCTGTPCSYEGGPYSAGSVSYAGIAYDKVGNKGSTGSKSFTVSKPVLMPIQPIELPPIEVPPIEVKPIELRPIDITPPSVGIRYSPTSPNTTQKVFFIASASDAGGMSKVQIVVNGRIMKSCTGTPCSYEGGPYSAGSVSYAGIAYDKAGNKGSTGSKSFTVSRSFLMPIKPIEVQPKDKTPPSVGIRYSPTSPNTMQKVIFTASGSDAGGISKVQIMVNGRIVKSCTGTPCSYEGGPYSAGSVSYSGIAYDKAGNKGSTGSKSFTVSKPVLIPIQPIPLQPLPRTLQ